MAAAVLLTTSGNAALSIILLIACLAMLDHGDNREFFAIVIIVGTWFADFNFAAR